MHAHVRHSGCVAQTTPILNTHGHGGTARHAHTHTRGCTHTHVCTHAPNARPHVLHVLNLNAFSLRGGVRGQTFAGLYSEHEEAYRARPPFRLPTCGCGLG